MGLQRDDDVVLRSERGGVLCRGDPVDALDAATLAFCRELSPLSSTAIAQAKRCLAVAGGGTEEGYAREIEAIAAQFADADTRARIAAFFADKPAPR